MKVSKREFASEIKKNGRFNFEAADGQEEQIMLKKGIRKSFSSYTEFPSFELMRGCEGGEFESLSETIDNAYEAYKSLAK